VCQHPENIDFAIIHGYGFPRWRGGPEIIARQMSAAASGEALDELAVDSGKAPRGDSMLA
jgi:3-hydroxyacyl-CoA dehydrogenase